MHNCSDDNEDKVVYCPHCMSLAIRVLYREDPSLDYCGECGNTNLETTDIDTWEKMYQEKYGTNFLTTNKK